MAYNRRKFIRQGSRLAGLTALSTLASPAIAQSIDQILQKTAHLNAFDCARNEDFWNQIRQAYSVSPVIINFNNGAVSPQPIVVQEAVAYYSKMSNEVPTVNWRRFKAERQFIKTQLGQLAGCSAEEIALHRNTTEALSTVIFGLPLQKGDEVVLSRQDYPNMINAWKQRAKRDGIVLKWVNWQFPSEDKEEMVRTYIAAFTNRTKVAHITHVINWNGQVIPVREIAAIAQQRGIEVVVDAAHSFAQFPYQFSDLHCDYLGTSLHKWLCAPFGTGLLYVKKDKIKNLYPLFATEEPDSSDITKFEALGTISIPLQMAIAQAIEFHLLIGAERKQERLQYLKNYWIDQVKHLEKVNILSSQQPEFSSAIALFSIKGKDPKDFYEYAYKKYRIHTISINRANIQGIRIVPNVYTLTRELDVLVEAIKQYVLL